MEDRTLTSHFSFWLANSKYAKYNFERSDLKGGSFGGKASENDIIKKEPVIFIHGNSDVAVGYPPEIKK